MMQNRQGAQVDIFITRLEERFGLGPLVDEPDQAAARETVGGKPSAKGADKTGRVDSTAACLILRDFLNI